MTWSDFILKLSVEGREWLKIVIPALIALHMKQPTYMRKKDPEDKQ